MTEHKNLKIIAFAGLPGSRIDAIMRRLAERGIPRVSRHDIVSQIRHLADAGQHRIITDELDSLDLYKTMKHEFPGELVVVGIVTNRNLRHNRIIHQDKAIEDDWDHDQTDIATVIGMADIFLTDNGNEDALLQKIAALLTGLKFN